MFFPPLFDSKYNERLISFTIQPPSHRFVPLLRKYALPVLPKMTTFASRVPAGEPSIMCQWFNLIKSQRLIECARVVDCL